MTDVRIQSAEPTRPRPVVPGPPAPAAPTGPRMAGDTFVSRRSGGGLGRGALDKNGWWSAIQTFAQGGVRALGLGARALRGGPTLTIVAEMLDGDKAVIAAGVGRVTGALSAFFGRVLPGRAAAIMRVATPAAEGAGVALRAVGKAAPFVGVVAAGWDVWKASTEQDPARRPAAWANAGISVGGTAMAVAGVLVGATPVGWGLAIAAAGVAAFQLTDGLFLGGRATAAIGGWLG